MSTILQTQFIKFHATIRLDVDDNKQVIEKREMLIQEIRDYLNKKSEDEGLPLIQFITFMQGSYSMGTGIKPLHEDDDYDIDCGLLFLIGKDDLDPLEVKQWVYDALDIYFRDVQWKKACIRTQYVEEGMPKFHVDFAIYSDGTCNDDNQTYLAKGTPTISSDQCIWEVSEPKRLRDLINNKYTDDDECAQYKRIIRGMKRWKDYQFDSVNGRPTGIALTALSFTGFQPFTRNLFNSSKEINDLKAMKEFVNNIIRQFDGRGRISVYLPVPPGNNLFIKMTDQQCKNFKTRLEELRDALNKAENETDPHEACKILRKQFGDDFPVPPKEDTGQSRKKAIAGTSESA